MNFQSVKQTNYSPFQSPPQIKGNASLARSSYNMNPKSAMRTSIAHSVSQTTTMYRGNWVNQSLLRDSTLDTTLFAHVPAKPLSMTQVFEAIQKSGREEGHDINIKMMDTILFEEDLRPKKWIFTDLLGRIQYKDIKHITINDVIKAFLVNLNENKSADFSNEDLIHFLAKNSNRSKICFAIAGGKRHFLNIEALSDIKNKFPKGLEALQLYKIPTREFLPYFYYHTLELNTNQLPLVRAQYLTRLSHFATDLDSRKNKDYEEHVPEEQDVTIRLQILELSKQIVLRIQAHHKKKMLTSIKIAYLIEQSNSEPWFIGTEYCHTVKKAKPSPEVLKRDLSITRIQRPNSRGITVLNQVLVEEPPLVVERTKVPENVCLNVPTITDIDDEEEEKVYQVADSKFVTQSELLAGLQKVGQNYGRFTVHRDSNRPQTMQAKRGTLKSQQKEVARDKSHRIITLFPQYVDKTASKKRTNFLFGHTQSERVF